jgi:AcrR family transcriptional regulator
MTRHGVQQERDDTISDRRLLRGARSRKAVTRHAVDIASLEGLDGLSFGRLAKDLSLSKAGIQTLFRTKEGLQLATAETAREVFFDAVIRPALSVPEGVARLRDLIERWIAYAAQPLFPGGCFWSANLPEFDSRPGAIRDTLLHQHHEWLDILARQLERAVAAKQVADIEIDVAVFQINAVLNAANIALRLGDTDSLHKVHRVIDQLLSPSQPKER